MIILYTFDVLDDDDELSLTMLKLSLFTVLRELSKPRILVYTTTLEKMRLALHEYINDIELVEYKPLIALKKSTDLKAFNHHNLIGHARVFLAPHILETFKEPVLYLDNDTGFNLGMGPRFINFIKGVTIPFISNPEHDTVDRITRYYYPDIQIPDRIVCAGITYPLKNHWVHNNGIEYYPYNETGKKVAKMRTDLYMALNETMPTHFNDMYSISMVLYHEFGLVPTIYLHSPLDGFRSRFVEQEYYITHYYYDKWKILKRPNERHVNLEEMVPFTYLHRHMFPASNKMPKLNQYAIPTFYSLMYPPEIIQALQSNS
jgi:hypothetical protein